MKMKKASSNYDTKQCTNHTIQRMALKEQSHFFQLKNKTSKAKKVLCEKLLKFSLNQALKDLVSNS